MLLINFKCYKEATGKQALSLAKEINKIAKKTKSNIAIAVQAADLYLISKECKNLKVFSQHIDAVQEGPHTGSITALAVKSSGASGVILNHSEHKLKLSDIESTIKLAKEQNLVTVVCAENAVIGKAISDLNPDYIAIEPPELISSNLSISKARPGLIREAVYKICNKGKCEKLLVGAGIHSKEDVKRSLELGAHGILISSAIVKAKNPSKLLLELVKELK